MQRDGKSKGHHFMYVTKAFPAASLYPPPPLLHPTIIKVPYNEEEPLSLAFRL